jgi:hypothetical protein
VCGNVDDRSRPSDSIAVAGMIDVWLVATVVLSSISLVVQFAVGQRRDDDDPDAIANPGGSSKKF